MQLHRRINRRSFLSLAGLAAIGVGAAACSSKSSNSSSQAATETSATSSTDRVVALNTGQLDNLLTLGILPVGVALAKGTTDIPQFIKDAFGSQYDLSSIEQVGLRTSPDIEKIAALKPTLICANSRLDSSILEQLRAIAPVVTGDGGGENWKKDFLTIAGGVNKTDKAQSLLDDYDKSVKEAAAGWGSDVPEVSFLRTKSPDFQIYGVASMAGTVAADMGLRRPASEQFTDNAGKDLSAEEISQADAEWIFYGVADGANSPTKTPSWSTLKAVQDGHAIEVDNDAWYLNASILSATIIRDGLLQHLKG